MNRDKESQRKSKLLIPYRDCTQKFPIHLPDPGTTYSYRLPLCCRFDVKFSEQSRDGLEDISHSEAAADAHAMAGAEWD